MRDLKKDKEISDMVLPIKPRTPSDFKFMKDAVSGQEGKLFFLPSGTAANRGRFPIQYFIPDSDDRVDPKYDFLTDTHFPKRNPYLHDVYSHQIFSKPNYDGILVSKMNVEHSKKKKQLIQEMGIHKFLRFPDDRPIMGDCGAFGYIHEVEPPYKTGEILQYYDDLGFNMGVSIDHLIVGPYAKDEKERQRRFNLTLKNAEDFIIQHKTGNYKVIPYGVAQGWDEQSYYEAVRSLLEMGYKHICIGGLVKSPTKHVIRIISAASKLFTPELQVHLFGVARLDAMEQCCKYGVTSMDSASYLRRAWLGSKRNYIAADGKSYAAIRVPPVTENSVRVRRMIREGRGTFKQFADMEKHALKMLRLYDKGTARIEETLAAVLQYDECVGDEREKHVELYRELLEEKPWKMCGCPICKDIGIEVVIFRGNNRNRRRGFHNVYVFYQRFEELVRKQKPTE